MCCVRILVFVTALVYCCTAFPDSMFSRLREVKRSEMVRGMMENGLMGGLEHVQRAISELNKRAMTTEQKCDRLEEAFQGIVDAVHGQLHSNQVQGIRKQLLDSTGIDIYEPSKIRQESCAMASISTMAELASKFGVSESTMRQFYPTFVDTINTVRSILRDSLNSTYLPRESRALIASVLDFYDAMDEIGLLSIS